MLNKTTNKCRTVTTIVLNIIISFRKEDMCYVMRLHVAPNSNIAVLNQITMVNKCIVCIVSENTVNYKDIQYSRFNIKCCINIQKQLYYIS